MKCFFITIVIFFSGLNFQLYASELGVFGAYGKYEEEFFSSLPVECSYMGVRYVQDISPIGSFYALLRIEDEVRDYEEAKGLRGYIGWNTRIRFIHFGIGKDVLISTSKYYVPGAYIFPAVWLGIGPKDWYVYAGFQRYDILYSLERAGLFSCGMEGKHSKVHYGTYFATGWFSGFLGAYFEPQILETLFCRVEGYLTTVGDGGGGGSLTFAWRWE